MKTLLKICMAVGLVAACVTPAAAQVGTVPRWNAGATNNPSFLTAPVTVTNGTTLTIASNAVPVQRGRGMAILPLFVMAGADAGTLTFKWNVSYNGTNWTTTTPLVMTSTCNGTTAVMDYTNFLADRLDNVRFIRLAAITGSTGAVATVSNVAWSVFP